MLWIVYHDRKSCHLLIADVLRYTFLDRFSFIITCTKLFLKLTPYVTYRVERDLEEFLHSITQKQQFGAKKLIVNAK